MRMFDLNGSRWRTIDDFYDALFEVLGSPEWHGRSLDALNDSIGTGSVNKIDLPYSVKISGNSVMGPEARNMVAKFANLIALLQAEGCEVTLSLLD